MIRHHDEPHTRTLLRRFELLITRRLAGALHGEYQGLFPGPGSEAGESRPYVPGDDVRLIDWNLTARTTLPHVRDPIADHELDEWVVVDLSPSQGFGSQGGEKRDLALFAAAAFGYAANQLADRVAAVLVGERVELVPPRSGEMHLLALLQKAADMPRPQRAGRTDLAPALARTGAYATHRGLVAVISDFLVEPGWDRELRRLVQRHTVVAVEVVDPLELSLPPVGQLVVRDPETGDTLVVDTSDADLRGRYREAAAQQRAQIQQSISRAGAEHLRLRTDQDWVGQMVRFFQQRRQRRYGYRRSM